MAGAPGPDTCLEGAADESTDHGSPEGTDESGSGLGCCPKGDTGLEIGVGGLRDELIGASGPDTCLEGPASELLGALGPETGLGGMAGELAEASGLDTCLGGVAGELVAHGSPDGAVEPGKVFGCGLEGVSGLETGLGVPRGDLTGDADPGVTGLDKDTGAADEGGSRFGTSGIGALGTTARGAPGPLFG